MVIASRSGSRGLEINAPMPQRRHLRCLAGGRLEQT